MSKKQKRRRHGAVICSDLEVLEIQRRDVPFKSRHVEVMNYLKYLTSAGFMSLVSLTFYSTATFS